MAESIQSDPLNVRGVAMANCPLAFELPLTRYPFGPEVNLVGRESRAPSIINNVVQPLDLTLICMAADESESRILLMTRPREALVIAKALRGWAKDALRRHRRQRRPGWRRVWDSLQRWLWNGA